MSYPTSQKNGFTLVELSIALVMIGLLIGGILVGQSLIDSAKVNSTISQIQQFDSAVMAFKDKHKGLPGDSRYFGGDGDGAITRSEVWAPCTGPQNTLNVFEGEIANFWNHLFPQKYIGATNGTRIDYDTSTNFYSRVPRAKMGIKGTFFLATSKATSFGGDPYCPDPNLSNYYVITAPGNVSEAGPDVMKPASTGQSATKQAELAALDQKIDDGLANQGSVLAGSFRAWNGGASEAPSASCSSGASYVLTNDSYECTPLIRIGGQAGSPL